MKPSFYNFPTTRREFLRMGAKGIGLLAFSQFAPSFLTAATREGLPRPEKDRTILVVVQLAGGNDGLNTVVPFGSDEYYKLRPNIGIAAKDVLKINGHQGLHPNCAALYKLFQDGRMGIVQNVGYPNPNRSHFRSSEIWETASDSNEYLSAGWLGRFLDNTCAGTDNEAATGKTSEGSDPDPTALYNSDNIPQSLFSIKPQNLHAISTRATRRNNRGRNPIDLLEDLLDHPEPDPHDTSNFLHQTMMNALVTERRIAGILGKNKPEAKYPQNGFANSLRNVAGLIASGLETRVYFVSLGGFDTHSNQLNSHARLMTVLSEGLAAFQADLEARKLDDQVLTMTFSEFGRRANENASQGTDHGTSAPLFIMGSKLKQNLVGTPPNLVFKENQYDPVYSTDFRQVYATVLDQWMSVASKDILGGSFDHLPIL